MPNIAKIVCGTRGGVGFGGAIKTSIRFTLTPGSPNAELSLAVDYPKSIQSLFMPQDKKLIVPENDAELCSTLSAVSALEPCADKSEINLYYSEITLDDGTSYRVPYSQLDVLISALWRSCSERGFSSTPAPEPAPQPPAGSWKCPTCGAQRQNGKFCTECGLPKPADSENP